MRTRTEHKDAPGLPRSYSAVTPHYVRAFPEYLRATGYYCSNNAKTDYQFVERDGESPFTVWNECDGDAHWRNRPDDRPFFSVFNPTRTHESGMWPDKDQGVTGEPDTDPDAVEVPPYLPDTETVREDIARHYDNIHRSDDQLGELLNQLEADGELENTAVFIWSDHGRGLPREKRSLYDGGINIPLIVRWPGELDGGQVREEVVSLVDLAPTVLSIAGVDVPEWMHGRPFVGPEADDPRQYAFAARDRIDTVYDMSRAVRDRNFKYIRNYNPENPPLLWVPYRSHGETMQELLRLQGRGELEGPPADLMADSQPPEELYDLREDPHEVNNLAEDPAYRDVLDRLRAALDEWESQYDPNADVDEVEIVENWYPDGEQPVTETPVFTVTAPETGVYQKATRDGGEFESPTSVTVECSTQGASIGYRIDDGRWRLYDGRIELPAGQTTIEAKAVRYGFEESDTREATFVVR